MDTLQKKEYYFDTHSFWSKWGVIEQEPHPRLKSREQIYWQDIRFAIQKKIIGQFQQFLHENQKYFPQIESNQNGEDFVSSFYEKMHQPNLPQGLKESLDNLTEQAFGLVQATVEDVVGLVALEYFSRKKAQN